MGFGLQPKIDIRMRNSRKKRSNVKKSYTKQKKLERTPLTAKTQRHIPGQKGRRWF